MAGTRNVIDADMDDRSRVLRAEWRWLGIADIDTRSGLFVTVREAGDDGEFHFHWPSFHAYGARNESFIEIEPRGEDDRGPFREVFGAPFLAYARSGTWQEEGETLRHWQIAGSEFVLDVASADAPIVRYVEPDRS